MTKARMWKKFDPEKGFRPSDLWGSNKRKTAEHSPDRPCNKELAWARCQHVDDKGKRCGNKIYYNKIFRPDPPKLCGEHIYGNREEERKLTKQDLGLLALANHFPKEYYKENGEYQDWVVDDPKYFAQQFRKESKEWKTMTDGN